MNLLERATLATKIREQLDDATVDDARAVLGMVSGLVDEEIRRKGKETWDPKAGGVVIPPA